MSHPLKGYISRSGKRAAAMVIWQFYIAAAAMALAVLAVLVQAVRRDPGAPEAGEDLRVYRDQLREVKRDVARGILAPAEAERVQSEVSRRLIEADRQVAAAARPGPLRGPLQGGTGAAVGMIALVLGGMAWLYMGLGAPGYPDFGLAARLAASDEIYRTRPGQAAAEAQLAATDTARDPAALARVEALRKAVAGDPQNAETLSNLALAEATLGELAAARATQAKLIALKGAKAKANDHAALGWMMIAAAGGYVSPEAEAELVAALRLDPQNSLARYYSGLMFAQVGRPDRAFALWEPLLREGPESAPWMAPIRLGIADLAARAGIRYALPESAGPSAADIAAAAELSPEDRQAMVAGMVQQLADRLGNEGGPPQDWARLITSLATLGRTEEAGAILAEARSRFAGQAAALAVVAAAGAEAGLP